MSSGLKDFIEKQLDIISMVQGSLEDKEKKIYVALTGSMNILLQGYQCFGLETTYQYVMKVGLPADLDFISNAKSTHTMLRRIKSYEAIDARESYRTYRSHETHGTFDLALDAGVKTKELLIPGTPDLERRVCIREAGSLLTEYMEYYGPVNQSKMLTEKEQKNIIKMKMLKKIVTFLAHTNVPEIRDYEKTTKCKGTRKRLMFGQDD
jgi:hypothetical protein